MHFIKTLLITLLVFLANNIYGQNLEGSKYRFAVKVFTSEKYQKKYLF